MSRIGRLPIEIPAGVTVTLGENNVVTVKGPLGTLTRTMHPTSIITMEGNHIHVARPDDQKETKAIHGLTRVLINNMVLGVTKGFSKTLVVNGVGYKVGVEGNKVVFEAVNDTFTFTYQYQGFPVSFPINMTYTITGTLNGEQLDIDGTCTGNGTILNNSIEMDGTIGGSLTKMQ